jgi:hypothetical protein
MSRDGRAESPSSAHGSGIRFPAPPLTNYLGSLEPARAGLVVSPTSPRLSCPATSRVTFVGASLGGTWSNPAAPWRGALFRRRSCRCRLRSLPHGRTVASPGDAAGQPRRAAVSAVTSKPWRTFGTTWRRDISCLVTPAAMTARASSFAGSRCARSFAAQVLSGVLDAVVVQRVPRRAGRASCSVRDRGPERAWEPGRLGTYALTTASPGLPARGAHDRAPVRRREVADAAARLGHVHVEAGRAVALVRGDVRKRRQRRVRPDDLERTAAEQVADSGQADRPFRPMPITRSGKAITRGVTPLGRSTSPASRPWSSPPSSS